MKIFILGGMFDPFHSGHLKIINYCLEILKADQIWILPNYCNNWKKHLDVTPLNLRVQMIKLAIKNLPNVFIKNYEFDKQPHLTYNTIKKIISDYPNIDFNFCIGTDNLEQLHSWYQIKKLSKLIKFFCFFRNIEINKNKNTIFQNTKIFNVININNFNSINISSSEIRKGINLKLQIPILNDYINDNNLYLKNRLISAQGVNNNRIKHCYNTANKAVELAKLNNISCLKKVYLSAFFHDITKYWPINKQKSIIKKYEPSYLIENPKIYHAISGFLYLKHYLMIKDKNILNGVKYHTLGSTKNMNLFSQIIYVADKICEGRNYEKVNDYRKLANKNITNCYKTILIDTYKRHKATLNSKSKVFKIYNYWVNKQ